MWGRLFMLLSLVLAVGYAGWLALEATRPAVGSALRLRDRPAIEAELSRLAALPLPGVDGAEEDAPTLGGLAEAAFQCIYQVTGRITLPDRRSEQAVMGYLLVLGAVGTAPETPLLEPRFRALAPLFAQGPYKVLEAAQAKAIPAEGIALIADFHATYGDFRHPLHQGLGLYDGTFPMLEFEALAGFLAQRHEAIADCLLSGMPPPGSEAMPSQSAGGETTRPETTVTWNCDDDPAGLRTTVIPTMPPSLRAEWDGRTERGLEILASSGKRFVGEGWAVWIRDGTARFARPDGSVIDCTVVRNG